MLRMKTNFEAEFEFDVDLVVVVVVVVAEILLAEVVAAVGAGELLKVNVAFKFWINTIKSPSSAILTLFWFINVKS